jgi:hypothetical protein
MMKFQVFRLRLAGTGLLIGLIALLIWGSWTSLACWLIATYLGAHLGGANTLINIFRAERGL